MTLTPLPEALDAVLALAPSPPASEAVPLLEAVGRVAAEDVVSPMDVPAADNSAMDGYALRAKDMPGVLPVVKRITAGTDPGRLSPETAARIFTGALVPEGADTVVMQERVEEQQGRISVSGAVSEGDNIRRRGADIATGDGLVSRGQRLTPQSVGVLASVGLSHLTAYRRLRVAVLSTGDELVTPGEPEQPIAPWQLYNSNRFQLLSQLIALGYETLDLGSLEDDPDVIGEALESAASRCDCIVSTGGVSVGEADYVREQIEARGGLALWKLAIKPGKPLAFGHVCGTPVFGLPGNPVSAWATFLLVVKPWLSEAQGALPRPPARVVATTDFAIERAGSREEYLRVTLSGGAGAWVASLSGSQSSGVLTSVSRADGLGVVPIGATVNVGDTLEVLLMESLQSPFTS